MTRVLQRLAAIGKQLSHPPLTKDAILKNLKQAAELLSEMKQSQDVKASIEPLTRALVLPLLTSHKDKDVRLLTTTCIMEILRIVAPDAPYSDKELREIFRLVVSAFDGLNDPSSSSFPRRTAILEITANLRICVVMLDIGCDDLIEEMFQIFFSVVSDQHAPSVLSAMQSVMAAMLEESEKIPMPLLDLILNNLLKKKKGVSSAAHRLAIGLVQQCADKLEPYVQRLLTSVMLEGKGAEIDLCADYHDIVYEIYQCAPQMLLAVIPNFTQELLSDKVNVRLKAVKLLGRLFALPGQHVAREYRPLFLEFLRRFTDKATEIRLAMIDCVKDCLKANPQGTEAADIIGGLDDRILDSEEAVRSHAVAAICDVAKHNFKWIPVSLLKHVAERLRDKKVLVRKEAFQRLVELYRTYATKCYEGFSSIDMELEWIPGKLLRCCYDKDVKEFRPAALEVVICERLFPRQTPVSERVKHWIAMYSIFQDIDKKALGKLLLQKRRLQEEFSKYLTLRQQIKETGQEDPQIQQIFKMMSVLFIDDGKTEEHFHKLHNMKDNKIFKAFGQLLDPDTSLSESELVKEDLLKRVGENHPQHDFIKILALRCSFIMFGKEHTNIVVNEITEEPSKLSAGLTLIAEFTGFFPPLIQDVKKDLLRLLVEGDAIVQERIAEIIARAGSSFRHGVDNFDSAVDLTLQKLCLEGTRQQAKYAVSALAALNSDDGFKSISVLYGRLICELREDNPHLPAVLQSLSSIAETAITIFETQEDDIVRFVVRSLLQKDSGTDCEDPEGGNLESINRVCELKIFGLKMLVKSFVPHKQNAIRRLRGLLGLLTKLLPKGEISETTKASEIDKTHLRFAALKGVLRLAICWDAHIPPSIFHLCLLKAQDPCVSVRQGFLRKLHQFIKGRNLNQKYASGFALFALETSKEVLTEAKQCLVGFIENARLEAKTQQNSSARADVAPITNNPEYVLTYLVHILAYHPSFPCAEADAIDYEPFYRMLLFFLRPLVHQDHEGMAKGDADNIPAILAIFREIKKADDAVEGNKTDKIRIVCELGIVISKELGKGILYSDTYPGQVPLPAAFYKAQKDGTYDSGKVDGSHLPPCLAEGESLSQLWTKACRPNQVQSLGNIQQLKKPRKDAEESSSSDQNGVESLKQTEKEVEAETNLKSRNHRRASQKRVQRKKKGKFGTNDGSESESSLSSSESDFEQENLCLPEAARYGHASENGSRSARVTRRQSIQVATETETSISVKKTGGKQLTLEQQLQRSSRKNNLVVEAPEKQPECQITVEDNRPKTRYRASSEMQPNSESVMHDRDRMESGSSEKGNKSIEQCVDNSEKEGRRITRKRGKAQEEDNADEVNAAEKESDGFLDNLSRGGRRATNKRGKVPTEKETAKETPSNESNECDERVADPTREVRPTGRKRGKAVADVEGDKEETSHENDECDEHVDDPPKEGRVTRKRGKAILEEENAKRTTVIETVKSNEETPETWRTRRRKVVR